MKRRSFLSRVSAALAALPFVGPALLEDEGEPVPVPEKRMSVEVRGTDARGEERVETYRPRHVHTEANIEAGEYLRSGDLVKFDAEGRAVPARREDGRRQTEADVLLQVPKARGGFAQQEAMPGEQVRIRLT